MPLVVTMRMNNTLLILGRNLVPFNSLLSDCNQAMLIRGMVINNCDLGNLDHHVNVIFLIMRCLNDQAFAFQPSIFIKKNSNPFCFFWLSILLSFSLLFCFTWFSPFFFILVLSLIFGLCDFISSLSNLLGTKRWLLLLLKRCLNDCSLILVILRDEICKNLSHQLHIMYAVASIFFKCVLWINTIEATVENGIWCVGISKVLIHRKC
jgi:hypothetical protein